MHFKKDYILSYWYMHDNVINILYVVSQLKEYIDMFNNITVILKLWEQVFSFCSSEVLVSRLPHYL